MDFKKISTWPSQISQSPLILKGKINYVGFETPLVLISPHKKSLFGKNKENENCRNSSEIK